MGDTLKDYKENKGYGQTRRDRASRNSTNNVYEREILKKATNLQSKQNADTK
jgi:hypothetical protein